MPSINVDLDFFSHRKTMRLSAQLGDHAITSLLRLWCYVGRHDPKDGSLDDLRDYEIEHIANWTGERGQFVRTLISIGFLDMENGRAKIHGWEEHSRHLILYREKAKRAANTRWANRRAVDVQIEPSIPPSNALSMPQAFSVVDKSIGYAPSIPPSNANTIQGNTIQIKNKKPRKIPWPIDLAITDELRRIAQERGFDPEAEFMRAKDHCLANGKQYADYHAFLRNWFRNEQFPKKKTVAASIAQPCQERVQRGNFLKPCGEVSVAVLGGRPLCQAHKEYHERKSSSITT